MPAQPHFLTEDDYPLPGPIRPFSPNRASAARLAALPAPVLERIFAFVCPHTQDCSYETQEQSSLEDACMLCDTRDLSHCALVNRRWSKTAPKVLYHSIRIETVHYCNREALLADKRKRRTFLDRNGVPEDTSQKRLKLLCRTLREDPARLGPLVEYFKLPYMLREACQADIARTIAVLPNLLYVDLPEGLYQDDNAYITLRMEVEARCLNLRKMTYMHGSERSLERVASGQVFRNLEVLELKNIQMDGTIILHALGALGGLRALKISGSNVVNDDMIAHDNEMLPPFPALEELILDNVPGVSSKGLRGYLTHGDASRTLKVLNVAETGVKPWNLQDVLAAAPMLKRLTITYEASTSLPLAAGTPQVPPLASTSLETFHYEVTSAPSASPYSNILPSFYNYLSGSLLMGGLPNLRALYVRDANFPNTLLGLPPPLPRYAADPYKRPGSSSSHKSSFSRNGLGSPGFPGPFQNGGASYNPFQEPPKKPFAGAGHNPRFSSNNPFASLAGPNGPVGLPQTLEVFTKGDDELNWGMVKVDPAQSSTPVEAAARPSSSYGLDNSDSGWNSRAGARRSVFMGDGTGGFLAVPGLAEATGGPRRGSAPSVGGGDGWPRPSTATQEKRSSRIDLWR
ncbi:F-box domain-containing protein [Diaporthe sp. PMI_573]|nr:F-box domain-containing protein [Diaporthaceae sp. PMI_573]